MREALLTEKRRTFEELHRQNPGLRKAGLRGAVYNLYAHYLRWTLGDFDNVPSAIGWAVFKGAFVAVELNLLVRIVEQVVAYLSCPKPYTEGLSYAMEPAGYDSSYNAPCLHAYLATFNKVPGQPASNLALIFQQFNMSGINLDPTEFTTLNFTGRGVTGAQMGGVLQGLQHYLPAAVPTRLDLSDNNIGQTTEDMQALLPYIPKGTTYLDLSRNQIGTYDENTGVLLGQALPTLTQLQVFRVAGPGSEIGTLGEQGTVAIGKALPSLTNLQSLDLSWNQIGLTGDSGTVALGNGIGFLTNLQNLDLSQNYIGQYADTGTFLLGSSLKFLTSLQKLDLSFNYIGYTGSNGTAQIGEGLSFLARLQSLDLSNSNIGYTGSNGTIAIGKAFQYLKSLELLDLSNSNLGLKENSGVSSLGNALTSLENLQVLDLSGNYIGYKGEQGAIAIGGALPFLVNLESLDLSDSVVGYTGDNGTLEIGRGLAALTNLQFLDVSRNYMASSCTKKQDSKNQCGVMDVLIQGITQLSDIRALYVQQLFYKLQPYERETLLQYWNNRGNQSDVYTLRTELDIEAYLATLSNFTRTVFLSSWFQPENETGVETFMKGITTLPFLEMLDLSNNNLGAQDGQLVIIGNYLSLLTNIRALNLSQNQIGSSETNGTVAIATSLSSLTKLQNLDLSSNSLGYTSPLGLRALGKGLTSLTNLQRLNLSTNAIGKADEGASAIGNAFRSLENLQVLDASSNSIGIDGDNGTLAMGKNIGFMKDLKYLDLSGNWIGYKGENGTVALANSLSSLANLQYVDFSGNSIGLTGNGATSALAKSLPVLPHLEFLDVSYNPLGSNLSSALYNFSNTIGKLLCQGTQCNVKYTELSFLPWDKSSSSQGAIYSTQIQQACEANACF